jgi:sirohydrochlorin cobaltochelatase
MAPTLSEAALLLLGHGSTLNADSSAPTYQHAEEIRRRGIFAEVHVGFWKEEPNFRQALRQTDRRQVYVVPNFISSGYFTEQIIPRELGLSGPVTHLNGQDIFYCQPVGLHASMTEALLRRANEVVTASKETIADPAKTVCLFICGHGTSFNDNSTKIIYEQAAIIRQRGIYADCQAVLMEQTPFVKDWRTLTNCADVIVVPFFISDGLHSFEDIPVLLGLTHNVKEQSFTNPHREGDRRLWYATAIGTEAFVADVIVAQVRQAQVSNSASSSQPDGRGWITPQLAQFLQQGDRSPRKIGQVAILHKEAGAYDLMHEDDLLEDFSKLRRLQSPEDLSKLILLDADAKFRPLRASPNLRRGWIYPALTLTELHLALEYLYPAVLVNWGLHENKELPVTPWCETAERQTGRFRIVREIEDNALQDLVWTYCQTGCLKRRLWSPAAQKPSSEPNEIPLLCPEACNFLVGKAREKLKGTAED